MKGAGNIKVWFRMVAKLRVLTYKTEIENRRDYVLDSRKRQQIHIDKTESQRLNLLLTYTITKRDLFKEVC